MKIIKQAIITILFMFILFNQDIVSYAEELSLVVEEVYPEEEEAPAQYYPDVAKVEDSFAGSYWTVGNKITIPVKIYCFGNFGEKYYVNIRNSAGKIVKSATGSTKQGFIGVVDISCVWSAEDTAKNSYGVYYVECYTTNSTDNVRTAFYLEKGWSKESGKWYYYNHRGNRITGWKVIDGKYYYFSADAVMQTGWVKVGSYWYYLGAYGTMQTGWKKIGGKWYYMDDKGIMQTGWVKLDGKWYYFGLDGIMRSDWQKIGGKWYYFKNGIMKTGWLQIGKSWYYFNPSGVMQTGWLKLSGSWYYMNSSGVMQTGWVKIGDNWHYFYGGGNMAVNTTIGNYVIDENGIWVQ